MNTIYKWKIPINDVVEIEAQEGARFLHVDVQHGDLTLWGMVDDYASLRDYKIAVVGTGNCAPSEDEADYIGSVLMDPFVWHVFVAKDET